MNIIINREKPRASGGFTVKKQTKNFHPPSANGSGCLAGSWLALGYQSVAESTLPARLSDASADNNVYY